MVWLSLPRMRGDRPDVYLHNSMVIAFTPHARGSTAQGQEQGQEQWVYPACAGIDLGA